MKRIFLCSLVFITFFALKGCNVVAGVSYALSEEPQQEALFVLPDAPTVVFVDDRRNILHPARLRRVVADEITKVLLENKLVTTVIAPQDILRVSATKDRYGELLPIGQLGSAVGASTVIYVEMTAFALTTNGKTPNPVANCRVSVYDVNNKARCFPISEIKNDSHPVLATIKNVDPYTIHTVASSQGLAQELAIDLGKRVAEMFYLHYTGRLGENLDRK